MPALVTFSILDYSNETSRVGLYLPELTPGNYDSVTGDQVGESVGDIRVAMNALIAGNHLRRTVTAVTYNDTATLPTDPNAQRERKARFVYRDTVNGELGSFELPTADNSVLAQAGTDVIDLEEVAVAAFVAVVEANAVSRDGNAIEIQSAQLVGRNI